MAKNNKSDKGFGIDGLSEMMKDGTMDIVAYILVALGVLFTLANPAVGGLLVGLVTGFYFADEIMGFLKGADRLYTSLGLCRSLILGGALVSLVIVAYMFFITAGIVAVVTSLVRPNMHGKSKDHSTADEE